MLIVGNYFGRRFSVSTNKMRHPRFLLAGTEFRRQGVNENRIIVSKNLSTN